MSSLGSGDYPGVERPPPVALAVAPADVPPRCETAFSEAQTLVRSSSNRSRSSIAKPPLFPEPPPGMPSSSTGPEPALRSIFPTYNHSVPLDRQDYFPTQASPTHIPRSAISRPLYSPSNVEPRTPGPALRSPMSAATPMSAGSTRWPPRHAEPPVIPPTSTTEELKGLWKVTNGWKASPSEGRVYCLRVTADKDAPIYTLSSDSQPFYNFRLDPTSTSAYVSLLRHDPHKPFKGTAPTSSSASVTSGGRGGDKHWQEALATTLEEESRRLPPNDGLVALLYPSAAAKMAVQRPDDPATVMLAEKECGRLVWDADSNNHFLVHQALAMPFCVTVERNAAWSRTEYTLEHIESPQHLARLTRDGTGNGWLELDSSIAAKIDSVYLADVAVAALMLVAHKDDRYAKVEVFEPPPVLGSSPTGDGGSVSGDRGSKRGSGSSWRDSRREERLKKKRPNPAAGRSKQGSRMEEFEMDIESQNSEMAKPDSKDKDKLPAPVRGIIKIITWAFKFVVWIITVAFKALAAIVAGLAKCAGVKPS